MKVTKKSKKILTLLCLSITVLTTLGSAFHLFQRHTPTSKANDEMPSWRGLRRDLSLNRLIKSWAIRNLGPEQDDKTTEPALSPIIENGSILIDRRLAEEVSEKIKVLCWIPTRDMYRNTRLMAVNSTWARRCDKVIYFITSANFNSSDIINVPINDSRKTLTDKTVYAHYYIYKHFLHDFDWFLKADDDTYVIMENLKFLLSHFDPNVPGYIGCQFKHFAPQGYMSGGSSYAFNSLGIQTLVEEGYDIPGRCRLQGGAEDIETGRCAYKAGIRTLHQLDVTGRQTFFPSNIYAHVLGPIPFWVSSYTRAQLKTGLGCCSPLLVSFHYTGTKLMVAMEFLLYRVVVHGRKEVVPKAEKMFGGRQAVDMAVNERRRPYPGELLEDYYKPGWREKNTTIFINPKQ